MKFLFKIFLGVFVFNFMLNAYDVNSKVIQQLQFENSTVYLPVNNYRTLEFEDRIKSIQLTNSENIMAEFIENKDRPLQLLKVLGKNVGNESAIVTLESGRTIQVNFNIMQNLDSIVSLAKATYPKLIVEQANNTIILKGFVKDYKEKELVMSIFEKASIDLEKQLVDMIETATPSKMIRLKLYAVEINNDDGLDLKNNWMVSSKNYMQVTDGTLYQNYPLSSYGVPVEERDIYDPAGTGTVIGKEYVPLVNDRTAYRNVNNQRIGELETALNGIMTNAVSLSGGLTGMANYLGKYFNVGLVLNYLASEGVANILDETTLLTLENKDASFHAGGTIRLKTQTTTSEGIPTSTVEKIKYGLQLDIKAKNIMNDEYIDLEITTSSTQIDWANQVDNIPSFLEKEIKTNVLVKNDSTIVLGGLMRNENSYDMDKIPALGEIPILGFLFKSQSFREGKSELVFFITPEVVDPAKNNQADDYLRTRKQVLDTTQNGMYKEKEKDSDENISEKKETTIKEVPKEKKTLLDYILE